MKQTSPITETGHPRTFKHADEADYAAFLARIPMDDSFRRQRLLYRSRFVESWPDINDWFSVPLPIRIGRLSGDTQAHPTYPVSFRARSYLYYAAMTDCIRLDYDFLFAVGTMRVGREVAAFRSAARALGQGGPGERAHDVRHRAGDGCGL